MVQRSLPLLLLAGLVSCKGDPTGDLRNGTDHLIANPSALFVGTLLDSTRFVQVSAVDEQGNLLSETFKLGAVTGPFTVTLDTLFQAVHNPDGKLVPQQNPTTVQYIVRGTANTGEGEFTVSAGGHDITIPIRMFPATGLMTLSTTAPALGDTVTATLGANLRFTATSDVSVSGGVSALKTSISADSTQMKFLIGPGASNSTVSISGVRITYSPTLGPISGVAGGMNTAPKPVIALSGTAANQNDVITATAPAGTVFPPDTRVLIAKDAQTVLSVAPDGSSLTFRTYQPGVAQTVVFAGATVVQLPQVPLRLNSSAQLAISNTITPLAGTDALATAPEIGLALVGEASGTNDQGPLTASAACNAIGNHCKFYKMVVPEDMTLTITFNWGNTADIGGYFLDPSGADVFGDFACDAHGSGATAQPETCTEDFTAGTYYIGITDFTGAAQNTTYNIKIERE